MSLISRPPDITIDVSKDCDTDPVGAWSAEASTATVVESSLALSIEDSGSLHATATAGNAVSTANARPRVRPRKEERRDDMVHQ